MFIGEGGLAKKLLGSASRTVASYGLVPAGVGVTQAVDDATTVQVVRTHLHFHSISHCQLDEMLAQLSGNMGKHLMPILKFHPKHGARKNSHYLPFNFDIFFATHKNKKLSKI